MFVYSYGWMWYPKLDGEEVRLMNIGGLLKFSLIDYPGKVAAVIFTQGCNFRCPYCHNPELVKPECFCDSIPESRVLDYLTRRVGQIDGVVVSGGEPTVQKDLIPFLREVRALGYPIKLDTNGSRPEVLREVLRLDLVDYVAMDLKALPKNYYLLTTLQDCERRIKESIKVILHSSVNHEFRTTLYKPIVQMKDLSEMASLIKGAKHYRLQKFVCRDRLLEPSLTKADEQFSDSDVAALERAYSIRL